LKNDLKFETNFLIDKILYNDDEKGKNVFSKLFEKNQDKEFYQDFLKFLSNELSGESLKIYLIRTKFLFSIAQNEDKQLLGEIFNSFVAKFGETFFSGSYSTETFHGICTRYSYNAEMIMNYLNLVAKQIGIEIFKNYVSRKNSKKQTILFYFHRGSPSLNLIKILNWFKTKFENDENFFKNFLLEVDENLDSFFNFVLKKEESDWRIHDYFKETYDFFIKNFDKVFVKELLLLQNKKCGIFLNIICESYGWRVTVILDTIFKDFQKDQDFFTKLINEKSKKNRLVKEFIKSKLKRVLPEEQTRRSNSCEVL
jgi:hypothetical protein